MAHAGRAGTAAGSAEASGRTETAGSAEDFGRAETAGRAEAAGSAARARADARAVFERAAARRATERPGIRTRQDAPAPAAPPDGGESEPTEPTRGILLVGPGASFGTQLLARFAAAGFVLATISRSADTVARVASELATRGLQVHTAVADVTDAPTFTAAVGRLAAEVGGLTVVVYNAKLSIRGTALTVSAATLNQTLAVNVTGALTTVQATLPLLADRPGAAIMFTTAGSRTEYSGGRFALALGKAGLAALGASVGPQASARGVRLRSVALEDRVVPNGPLDPETVADHYWQSFTAPRGSVFRLAARDPAAERDQLPLDV